jgi:cytochrome d ubiquinol oxidase subunit I
MNPIILSRMQFGITTIYHFFFVPLTLGLSLFVAIMETIYVRTGKEVYKRMTKFWGKLFVINFAMGVVTGIVMEFQFGMNWSQYARFVGDVFGVPLAIEALLAFFLESTFLGLWIFGWDRISKGLHAVVIWLVAIGSTLSAFWILLANSFMQYPVGYSIENGRAIMDDFFALLTNPILATHFLHVTSAGITTATLFIIAVSSYHLFRKKETDLFSRSFKLVAPAGLIVVAFLGVIGHVQALNVMETNPMKMIASEALWDSQQPASMSLFTIADQKAKRNIVDIRVPNALSLLIDLNFTGPVTGINQLQQKYEQMYGPGDYIPPINVLNYAFRIMVGLGGIVGLILLFFTIQILRKKPVESLPLLRFFPILALLPYLTNSSGWILTEMGRQPWIVFGLLRTVDGVSTHTTTTLLISLIGFTVVYGALLVVDAYLLLKFAKAGPNDEIDLLQEAAAELGE